MDELRDTVRDFFGKHAAAAKERSVGTFDRALWTRLTRELGLTGIPSMEDLAVVVEEAGRVLLPLPYLSTVATAMVSDGTLPGIADGTLVATLAVQPQASAQRVGDRYTIDGVTDLVLDGDVADVVVLAAVCDGEPGLFTVRCDDTVRRRPMSTLDLTRPVARLEFDRTPATRLTSSPDHALDVLHTLLAVESVGVAAASLDLTVVHLGTREQFGRPLAAFQALRHRVADLAVSLEAATSSAWYAVRAPASELPVVAPLAKLVAAEAAYTITAESIQLHGGIGFTWEHEAHRYFKRATVNRLTHGDPVSLRRLIGARAGL